VNQQLLDIALKRERLLERIDGQRTRLAGSTDGLRALCAGGDRALAAGRKIRDNPQWVMLAALALALLKPRRAWKLAKTGLFVWRAWAVVRRHLPGAAAGATAR
jgi:hypothetical protein